MTLVQYKMKAARAFAVLLIFVTACVIWLNGSTAYAAGGSATVAVENVSAKPGETVVVPVTIKDNPGVLGATLAVQYDSELTLVKATNGEAFSSLSMTKPGSFVPPCRFTWDGLEVDPDAVVDGAILNLTFEVSSDVELGSVLEVVVSGGSGAMLDSDLDAIAVTYISGSVTVNDFIPGDLDGDEDVNSRDVILARRHIVGGYEQSINVPAADVNNDQRIDSADVILMRRYIAGGYGVTLLRSDMKQSGETSGEKEHSHNLVAVSAVNPTCTESGNIAYWRCDSCGELFSDAEAKMAIQEADTILQAVGHVPVIDSAVAPTRTSTGLTEGSHCAVCGEVIKAQEVVKQLDADEYFITYDVANGDPYLAGLTVQNPNRTSYFEGDSFKLSNLSADGYQFLGWYDGAGDDAARITRVNGDTAENLELFAHWRTIVYTVQFESDLYVEAESMSYTTDKGLVLPTPRLSNYVFAGWTDSAGKLYEKRIPVGTTANITLTANWTSERNKTYAKPYLDSPIVIEDDENNVILFAYEIGRVENVPLYTIKDFGYISGEGVTRTETKTYSMAASEETIQAYNTAIVNATTDSASWVLSEEWNKTTEISTEWCEKNGLSITEAEAIAKSNGKNWNISSGSGGTSETIKTDTDNQGWTNNTKSNSSKSSHLNSELYSKVGVGGTGIGASVDAGFETTSGRENDNGTSHDKGSTSTSTNTANWNSSSSYGGSSSTTETKSTAKTLTEEITKTSGYAEAYSNGGSQSSTIGVTNYGERSNGYSATTSYDLTEKAETTSTWTTAATKAGYHRWVVAGTAHVYGVVGYDIETSSFFVYTQSVMDDETHEFEDYSYTTAGYNDNQNGVIGFEIPYDEIVDIVASRTCASDGLEVNPNGTVTAYTGSDTYVVIPEFYKTKDGEVVKITGITPGVFSASEEHPANTDIVTVVLSDYITEIPDGEFAGCTALKYVEAAGVTSIGASAFAGCTSMDNCYVHANVLHLGDDAFSGTANLRVDASNWEIVCAAASSGADNLILDLSYVEDIAALDEATIEIPSTMARFEVNGGARSYDGLSIDSYAGETVLNEISIMSNRPIPVKISSEKVTLNQANIASPGITLVLTADRTSVGLRGTTIVSSSSDYAVLSKGIELYKTVSDVEGKLYSPQKVMTYGVVSGGNLLECAGKHTVDASTYEEMLNPYKLTFDANGGVCEEDHRYIYNYQMVGDLPIPSRDYYTFDGWLVNGSLVSSDAVLPLGGDRVAVASWTENPISGWTKATDVPEGAQITATKWTYNLSTYKQVVESYTYYRYCSYYDGIWNQDSQWINGSSVYHEIVVTTPIPSNANKFADKGGKAYAICGPYGSCSHKRETQSYWWLKSTNYKTVLDKVESKESTTEPSGSNISNVVKWVQYRPKGVSSVGSSSFGVSADSPELAIADMSAKSGDTIEVDVQLSGNPGIIGATFEVNYDDRLTLVDIKNGEVFQYLDMTKPGEYISGCKVHWDAPDLIESDVIDGVAVTLVFEVPEGVARGDSLAVNVGPSTRNEKPDMFDQDLNVVDLPAAAATITIESDQKDETHLADGTYSLPVSTDFGMFGLSDEALLIVNGDDVTLIIYSDTAPDGKGAPKYDCVAKMKRSDIGDKAPSEVDAIAGMPIYSSDPNESARYWDGVGYVVDYAFAIQVNPDELDKIVDPESGESIWFTAAYTDHYVNGSGSAALAGKWSGSKDYTINYNGAPTKLSDSTEVPKVAFPEAYETVEGRIENELPKPGDVAEGDAESIHEIRAAYGALPDEEAANVSDEAISKLEACEKALKDIDDRRAADEFERVVAALPNPEEVSVFDESAIIEAAAAYELLDDNQLALVDKDVKDKLEACKAALAAAIEEESKAPVIERIAGESYANETAAAISEKAFDHADVIILARDDDFADALGATGLAGALNAPIVLTDRTVLSNAAAKEIARLGATKCYIIGGTGAMKEQLEIDLKAKTGITTIERVWGENSYDTSLECAKAIVANGGTDGEAIIAMSTNFQDALSMSSYAYKYKVPVVLQTWGATSADRGFTAGAQQWLSGKSLLVAGGPGAISEESLAGLTVANRLYGDSGYDTSQKIAEWMVTQGKLFPKNVVVTCGAQAPKGVDALAGAALGGKLSAPMLLVNANANIEGVDTTTVDDFYTTNSGMIKHTYVLGGGYVVPADLYNQLRVLTKAQDLSL